MRTKVDRMRTILDVRTLINIIKSDEVGWFRYHEKTIFIGYHEGRDSLGQTRKQRLYRRRRSRGLCVVCGKKVFKKNARTGRLYRLCDYHRKKLDKKGSKT